MRNKIIGFIILAIIGFTISECSSADRNDAGDIVKAGDVQARDTQLGDCYNELPGDGETFSSVKAVPCNEAHQFQLFYQGTSSLTSFSEEAARTEAEDICDDEANNLFNQMSAIKYDAFKNADLGYFFPTSESWSSNGDRRIECLIGSDTETYFSSVFD